MKRILLSCIIVSNCLFASTNAIDKNKKETETFSSKKEIALLKAKGDIKETFCIKKAKTDKGLKECMKGL